MIAALCPNSWWSALRYEPLQLDNPARLAAFHREMLQSQRKLYHRMIDGSGCSRLCQDMLPQWALRQSTSGAGVNQHAQPEAEICPLTVSAHAYHNSRGHLVPVRSIRIHTSNDPNSRQRVDNCARFRDFSSSYSQARLGETYTVTVEWEDGHSETVQAVNHGWPIEL